MIASLATVGVFVTGAIWAANVVGSEHASSPATPVTTYSSPDVPWTFERPADWSVATTSRAGHDLIANTLETAITNGPLPPAAQRDGFGPNSGGDDPIASRLGDVGAVVIVRRTWTPAMPPTANEWGPNAFHDDPSNPGWIFRERHRCDGTLCFAVIEWLGPEVSDRDRAASEAIAESVRLADVERWTETDGDRTTLHDEDDGFTVTYPAGWLASDVPINDWVCSPFEILSLATYPLRPGGEAVVDFQLPSRAVEDLGPNDILIWVNDSGSSCGGTRRAGGPSGFAERPAHFQPSEPCGGDDWSRLCPEPSGRVLRLTIPGIHAWWFGFADQGRGFYVFVGMGDRAFADPARAQQAWDVLDSLGLLPR
jgi:hypothetical protein